MKVIKERFSEMVVFDKKLGYTSQPGEIIIAQRNASDSKEGKPHTLLFERHLVQSPSNVAAFDDRAISELESLLLTSPMPLARFRRW